MKNTRQKGNLFQDWVAAWLREQGYDVDNRKTVSYRTPKKTWVTLAADIFGCDIIAMKTGKKPLFIQATAHSAVQKRLDEFLQYSWPLDYVHVQLWQKKDKEINIKEFDGEQLYDFAKIVKRKYHKISTLYYERSGVK